MISCSAPSGVRKVSDRFKSVFDCNYNCLCALFCLHLFGLESFCESARWFGWSQSVSSLHKAAHQFCANRFMRRLQSSVLKKLKNQLNSEDFCYAIDDTANPKFGKKVFGVGHWGKHGGGVYRGQKVMVLALVNKKSGYAVPLHYIFCKKKDEADYQSGHGLVVKLLNDIHNSGFPKLPVALDSWFDSASLMNTLDQIGVPFCIQCKENRVVKTNPSPTAWWTSWKEIFRQKIKMGIKLAKSDHQKRPPKTKYLKESFVYIKRRKSPLKAVAVYNHISDTKHFAIYVTNDLKMKGYFLYELSRKRWMQEELFRDLKQNFSFGRLPCTGKEGADLSICLPFALIVSLRLFPDELSQEDVSSLTIGTRVEKIKAENFQKSLHLLVHNPVHPCVKTIKSRRDISRIHKKPVNSIADERRVS
jgi:hypothetical protein